MIARAAEASAAMERLDAAGEEANLLLDQVERLAGAEMTAAKSEGVASHESATKILITVVSAAVVLGLLIGVLLTRSITKPLKRSIGALTEGADQVNDAASQVSSSSQQLAAGASEQASSLEETSAALEEMAAMTRTNAETPSRRIAWRSPRTRLPPPVTGRWRKSTRRLTRSARSSR